MSLLSGKKNLGASNDRKIAVSILILWSSWWLP